MTGHPAGSTVRGVAKVRGVARVPDALSMPPWPPLMSPSVVVKRPSRRTPPLDRVAPVPPLRAAVPAGRVVRSGTVETGGGVRTPVRDRLRHLGRRVALPAATAAMAAFVAATGYVAVADRVAPVADLGRWGAPGAVVPSASQFGGSPVTLRGMPTRVRIAAIGVDSPLERLRLGAGGALQPPRAFGQAGWYADGTVPGDPGPAVIAGHVDSKAGPAVFYRLRELTVGDRIDVVRGGTVVRFTVVRSAWYPKRDFPTTLVYAPTPDRQLRLITCGGIFDRRLRSYRDNLVVYAVAG